MAELLPWILKKKWQFILWLFLRPAYLFPHNFDGKSGKVCLFYWGFLGFFFLEEGNRGGFTFFQISPWLYKNITTAILWNIGSGYGNMEITFIYSMKKRINLSHITTDLWLKACSGSVWQRSWLLQCCRTGLNALSQSLMSHWFSLV